MIIDRYKLLQESVCFVREVDCLDFVSGGVEVFQLTEVGFELLCQSVNCVYYVEGNVQPGESRWLLLDLLRIRFFD